MVGFEKTFATGCILDVGICIGIFWFLQTRMRLLHWFHTECFACTVRKHLCHPSVRLNLLRDAFSVHAVFWPYILCCSLSLRSHAGFSGFQPTETWDTPQHRIGHHTISLSRSCCSICCHRHRLYHLPLRPFCGHLAAERFLRHVCLCGCIVDLRHLHRKALLQVPMSLWRFVKLDKPLFATTSHHHPKGVHTMPSV